MKKELLDKIAEILEVDSVSVEDALSSFDEWDAMGWTDDEIRAKEWVDLNPEYRQYKYCTDMKY